ncbi:MAG: hypothetical protein JWN28_710 [Candidatus Saccharibacteria bacterium]|nr:hypothetical protein [Candidatus Saccharibacteria bacterium]
MSDVIAARSPDVVLVVRVDLLHGPILGSIQTVCEDGPVRYLSCKAAERLFGIRVAELDVLVSDRVEDGLGIRVLYLVVFVFHQVEHALIDLQHGCRLDEPQGSRRDTEDLIFAIS